MKLSPTKPNKILDLLLVFAGTLCALLLAEGIIRLFDLKPKPLQPLPIGTYRLSDNPVLRFEFRPNYMPEQRPFDASHRGYRTNRFGFRDKEYAEEKPPGTFRIIVLGDSTTAGNGVPDERDLYTELLEEKLNHPDAKTAFEVLNMGVGGYHTAQEAVLLETKGIRFDPDLVLVVFCYNDFDPFGDGSVYERLLKKNRGLAVDQEPSSLKFLLGKSRLLFFLYHRIKSLLVARKLMPDHNGYENIILEGKTPVAYGFEKISALQSKYGFKTLVLLLPGFSRKLDTTPNPKVFETARAFPEIEVLDLKSYFEAARPEDGSVFSWDGCHLNEYGHHVLSEILFQLLTEKGLLPASESSNMKSDPHIK